MRVLLISHTCQSRRGGQPKAAQLGRFPGMQRVLVPDRWREYRHGGARKSRWKHVLRLEVGRVRLPWSGPGQWYLHYYPELAMILRNSSQILSTCGKNPGDWSARRSAWLRDRLLPRAKIIAETEQNITKSLPPPFETFRVYTLRHADFVVGRSADAVEKPPCQRLSRAQAQSFPMRWMPSCSVR